MYGACKSYSTLHKKITTKCSKFRLKMGNRWGCLFNLGNGQPFKKLSNGIVNHFASFDLVAITLLS